MSLVVTADFAFVNKMMKRKDLFHNTLIRNRLRLSESGRGYYLRKSGDLATIWSNSTKESWRSPSKSTSSII